MEHVLVTKNYWIFLFSRTDRIVKNHCYSVLIYNQKTHGVSKQTREYPSYSPISLHYVSDRVFMIHIKKYEWILCNMQNQVFFVTKLNTRIMICGNSETQTCFSLVRNLRGAFLLQQLC